MSTTACLMTREYKVSNPNFELFHCPSSILSLFQTTFEKVLVIKPYVIFTIFTKPDSNRKTNIKVQCADCRTTAYVFNEPKFVQKLFLRSRNFVFNAARKLIPNFSHQPSRRLLRLRCLQKLFEISGVTL